MKSHWLTHNGAPDLILIFGGWALGPAPFSALRSEQAKDQDGGPDVLFINDYRNLNLLVPNHTTYKSVSILAYSFGVASALHWLNLTEFTADQLVAVNGTPYPADPDKGIAPDRVRATAVGLSDASFARFCHHAGMNTPPEIDVPARRAELCAIADRGPATPRHFDRIWISSQDLIIPTAAQRTAWADQSDRVIEIDAPHMPFAPGQTWQDWLT